MKGSGRKEKSLHLKNNHLIIGLQNVNLEKNTANIFPFGSLPEK